MEMGVKRDKEHWTAARDNRVVRCECSCDREEQPMVLLGLGLAMANNCYAKIWSSSSNASAAKSCNIITAMALLERRTYTSITVINVFLKTHMKCFWGT